VTLTGESVGSVKLGALILTHDEEANIARTLASLHWIERILVVDSGSSDGTLATLAAHPAVEVLHRSFDSFAGQCNFGLTRLGTPWALSLDADYVMPHDLAAEILALFEGDVQPELAGYAIPFRYCIAGHPLRGALLPPRICLYRTASARYRDDGHGHRVVIDGPVGRLRHPLLHDDRKPIERWLASQQRYMVQEADKLLATSPRRLSAADRLRRHTPLAPLAVLLICLVGRGGVLDGWYGWAYALQRCYAELLLLLFLIERRLPGTGAKRADNGPARRETLGLDSGIRGDCTPS
jgi:glycosyltransferase involved in cell wall biosynthesis